VKIGKGGHWRWALAAHDIDRSKEQAGKPQLANCFVFDRRQVLKGILLSGMAVSVPRNFAIQACCLLHPC
jgi:hypothetical protein